LKVKNYILISLTGEENSNKLCPHFSRLVIDCETERKGYSRIFVEQSSTIECTLPAKSGIDFVAINCHLHTIPLPIVRCPAFHVPNSMHKILHNRQSIANTIFKLNRKCLRAILNFTPGPPGVKLRMGL
jgi:hypothetical protein